MFILAMPGSHCPTVLAIPLGIEHHPAVKRRQQVLDFERWFACAAAAATSATSMIRQT
jgi:hypothetical protein